MYLDKHNFRKVTEFTTELLKLETREIRKTWDRFNVFGQLEDFSEKTRGILEKLK